MLRKLTALVGLTALVSTSPVLAVGLDTQGTNPGDTPPPPPPVAPTTDCVDITLYASDWSAANTIFRYKFSGKCRINIAPAGKPATLRDVPVYIQGEWFPAMKRASEQVITYGPDLGITFTTGATCDFDPFVNVNHHCTKQSMAVSKFSAFLDVKDIPFAHGRTTMFYAKQAAAHSLPATFNDPVHLDHFQNPNETIEVGAINAWVEMRGGVGTCPFKVEWGDGTDPSFVLHPEPNQLATPAHTYAKPGVFTVKAEGILGCTGTLTGTKTVLTHEQYLSWKSTPHIVFPKK